MGDKNQMILRLALVLGVMCLLCMFFVPICSAEFTVLLFAVLADGAVILFSALKARKER